MATLDKVFLDTNIIVYQFDKSAPDKQLQAIALIEKTIRDETAVISSQVVQEFMNVALNKFKARLSIEELRDIMEAVLAHLCQHYPTFDFYERARTLYASGGLSYYDALIVQAALDLDCTTLYSEDMHAGKRFGRLTIKNPFRES